MADLTVAAGDLRVPVVSREAVMEFPGGVQLAGEVFIPSAAPDHDGPMRLVEWLNGGEDFFPFKIHGKEELMIVNKRNVMCLTAYHERDSGDYDELDGIAKCEVRIDTQYCTFSGNVVIDMPSERHRVLDVLNDGRRFIFLLDSGKEVHINKNFITGTVEIERQQSAGTV